MTETKFTPGPWQASPSEPSSGFDCFYILDADRHDLAWVRGYQHEPEKEANAHLIAAAPDLYAALGALVSRYVTLIEINDCELWSPEKEARVTAAHAALAKARGEVV